MFELCPKQLEQAYGRIEVIHYRSERQKEKHHNFGFRRQGRLNFKATTRQKTTSYADNYSVYIIIIYNSANMSEESHCSRKTLQMKNKN